MNKKHNLGHKSLKQAQVKQQYKPKHKDCVEDSLKQSKFRYLNEQLYTSKSVDAMALFKDEQQFSDYHEGYRQQVNKWPTNPLAIFIKELTKDKYKG